MLYNTVYSKLMQVLVYTIKNSLSFLDFNFKSVSSKKDVKITLKQIINLIQRIKELYYK